MPISPFVQEEYLSYYFNKTGADRLYDGVALRKELDFDLITRQNISNHAYFVQKSYSNWEVDNTTLIENGNIIQTIRITTPERVLTQKEGAGYDERLGIGVHMSTLEYLIKDEEDLKAFCKYCPPMGQAYENYILQSGVEAKKQIGDLGINCPWAIGSVYNLASTFIDVQNMMMDALVEEEYYDKYMSFFAEIVRENYKVFARSEYDAVGIQGNIANGALMGEDFFREHVMPYEQKALRPLIDAGMPTIYHNCGNARNLYGCYKDLGITVWETVAPTPMGDNDLRTAKEYFGDALVLSGGLDQVHFLKTASPDEVEKAAREQMKIGKEGGHYIFACSDYLEADTPLENVKAMLRGARAEAAFE